MSNRIIFQNKAKQFDIKIGEDKAIDTVAKNFIHELITDKGTSVFDKDYGTNFIPSLGNLVNIYKIDYFLQIAFNSIKDKHSVDAVSLDRTNENASDGFLELWITLSINGANVTTNTLVGFSGDFTSETIIEQGA